MFAVDYPTKENRFELIYCLLSTKYNSRIKVKTFVDEFTPVESIADLYQSANWLEKEVWNMNGMYIEQQPRPKKNINRLWIRRLPAMERLSFIGIHRSSLR